MKVITSGKKKRAWTVQVSCNGCAALLEVSKSDCRFVHDQRDGNFYSAVCPECGGGIGIAASVVDA